MSPAAMPSPLAFDAPTDQRTDIYNRLLRNRIVTLGTDVNDEVANLICAQLLYLEGEDSAKDTCPSTTPPGGPLTAAMPSSASMSSVGCDLPRCAWASVRRWGSSCCAPVP